MLTKATITQHSLKTTLLLYHTTGFDRLNGHNQVYTHNIKTYKTKIVTKLPNISFIQNT
jgi:hypothetical protein